MRLLVLDNRDSFVWNLAQAFAAAGATVEVLRSDAVSLDDLRAREPDGLVLSPGPGRPEAAGILLDAVRAFDGALPMLGVCLGHQAIGVAYGARLDRCPPCHGKPWDVLHDGSEPLSGLPNPFRACRYHSLGLDAATLPDDLVATAFTPEGVVMGLRHRRHPTFGVQFHPESFRTLEGPAILARFAALCR